MKRVALVLFAMSLVVSGHSQARVLQGIDALVAAAADETVKLIPPDRHVLAVSWFTFEGAPAGISDLLSGSLTTALANKARGRADVVSRQATDRILAETAFQMTDLADPQSQVRVGRQVGADLIVTGSIASAGDIFKLNGQLVAVETGVVLGGFLLDVKLEKELASRMGMGSEVIRIEKKPVSAAGIATTTRVLEDFSGGRTEVQISHQEWFGGDAVASVKGTAAVDPVAGRDGSACARFSWSAVLKTDDVVGSWGESYLSFAARIKPGVKPEGMDGLSLSLKPMGCSSIYLVALQTQQGEERSFGLDLFLNEGEWQDLKIPFALFQPPEHGVRLDPTLPFAISIEVPFDQNWHRFMMRTGKSVAASLLVDNVGLYQAKAPDPSGLIESFDDEIWRAAAVPELYGAARYSETDSKGNSVDRPTPGVKRVTLRALRTDGAPAGRGLTVAVTIEAGRELIPLLDKGNGFTLTLSLQTARSWQGARALSFFARSDLVTGCMVEYQDNENERYYSAADIDLNDTWARIRIPLEDFRSEEGTLAAEARRTVSPRLMLYFELSPEDLREAASKGSLRFEVALDNLTLE